MWKQLEPELYFHYRLEVELTDQARRRIARSLNQSLQISFGEMYETDADFEILFEEGSVTVRAKVAIATLATVLIFYGGIRSSIDYLSKDIPNAFSYSRDLLRQQPEFGDEISVQRRLMSASHV